MSMPIGNSPTNQFTKKSLLGGALLVLAIGFGVHSMLPTKSAEMLSCRVGSYWVYDTNSREQLESGEIKTVSTKKKFTVLDAINGKNISVALVECKDLSGVEPATYSIRLVFDNIRFYEYDVAADDKTSSWEALKNQIASGKKLEAPDENSLQMILPSEIGTKWDEEGGPNRTDNMYCWFVENIRALPAATEIANNKISDKTAAYTISFRTCPDHQVKTFVPGIGFIDSQYRHHGTVCDTDERLVEFRQGS